jgi:hypothetical protein
MGSWSTRPSRRASLIGCTCSHSVVHGTRMVEVHARLERLIRHPYTRSGQRLDLNPAAGALDQFKQRAGSIRTTCSPRASTKARAYSNSAVLAARSRQRQLSKLIEVDDHSRLIGHGRNIQCGR